MTLAVRIIPLLLKRGNSLVKGKYFNATRVVGSPLQAARVHAARGVDELMLLDIGREGPDIQMVKKLTESAFHPVTVGGGIRSLEDVQDLFNAGADKVALRTCSIILTQIADKYGCQAVCAVMNWVGKCNPTSYARMLEDRGAGEILLQCVERDGMMEGYDLRMIEKASHAVNIPVIASCGCGTFQHMVDAVNAGADGVAAGAFFQFTNNTPKGAAEYLSSHGIEART